MVTITISIRPCLAAYLYVQTPEIHNYLGRDNLLILEKIIETELREHLYEYMKEGKYLSGVPYRQSLRRFLEEYGMKEWVSEEGIIRTFQRWRKKMREVERGVKSFFINC